MSRTTRQLKRMAGLTVMLCAAALSGCAPVAIVANAFTAGSAVKARYTLPEGKRVLVLVDDPNDQFNSQSTSNRIVSQVNFQLKQHLDKIKVVSVKDLGALETKEGDRFASMSLVTVGRKLNAAIVIYVKIESVNLNETYGVAQPKAQAAVTVINANKQTRLFPHPGDLRAHAVVRVPGYPATASLGPITVDQSEPGTSAMLIRKLTDRLALRVAELFYDHAKNSGSKLSKH